MNHLLSSGRTHPGSWWLAGLGLALTASLTTNTLVLFGISLLAMLVVKLCRDDSPWSRSIWFYVQLGLIVLIMRLAFRIIFNLADASEDVFLRLPSISIDLGMGNSIHLFGSVSYLSMQAALVDGLRLAAIILSIGMANSLANPRKLLRATPGALYEIATAIAIAINLAPQLIISLNQVRGAKALRGRSKGIRSLTGIVIPVLEDTIEQSMKLAASMSARGFGRKQGQGKKTIILARLLSALTLTLLTVGVAALLFSSLELYLDLLLILLGLSSSVLAIRLSSQKNIRTKYIVQSWRFGDAIILCLVSSVVCSAFTGALGK